jgi:mRNA-degrading endonuclease toxin of MazEF toxin-antitoxin module
MVDLGLAAKVRPCLVLSVPLEESDRSLVTLVPHTTSRGCGTGGHGRKGGVAYRRGNVRLQDSAPGTPRRPRHIHSPKT